MEQTGASAVLERDTYLDELFRHARAAAGQGSWRLAYDYYRKALLTAPTDVEALLGTAESLRRSGDRAGARKILKRGLAHYPDESSLYKELYKELGRIEVLDRNFEQGLKIFSKLLAEGRSEPIIWRGKLRCLRELGRTEELDEAIKGARAAFLADNSILLEIAHIELSRGEYETAVERFQIANHKTALLTAIRETSAEYSDFLAAVVDRFGGDKDVLQAVADAYVTLGKDVAAVEVFTALYNLEPANELVVLSKLAALKRLQRFDPAEQLVVEALERQLRNADLKAEYADLLWRKKAYEKAAKMLGSPARVISILGWRDSLRTAEPLLNAAKDLWPEDPSLDHELAKEQTSRGKVQEAVASYRRVLGRDENNIQARLELIALLRNTRELLEAEGVLAEGLRKAPKDRRLLDVQGELHLEKGESRNIRHAVRIWMDNGLQDKPAAAISDLMQSGRLSEALELADAALKFKQDSAQLLAARGDVLSQCRSLKDATEMYRKAAGLEPENRSYTAITVSLLRSIRCFEPAEELLKQGFERFGESCEDLSIESAWLDFAQNRYPKALKAFDALLAGNRWNYRAWEGKALSVRALQGCDAALQVINAALEANADVNPLWVLKGELLMQKDKPEEALECFTRAAGEPIPQHDAQVRISAELRIPAVLMRLNRPAEAVARLKGVLAEKLTQEHQALLLTQRAMVHLECAEFEIAKQVIDSIPETAGLTIIKENALGIRQFELGEYGSAEEKFRFVLKAEPYEPYAQSNVAWALVRQVKNAMKPEPPEEELRWYRIRHHGNQARRLDEARLDEAEKLAESALKTDRFRTSSHSCLGMVAFKRGRLAEAESYFKESIRLNASEGDHTSLGALHRAMGKFDEAKQNLQLACNLAPRNAQPRIELGELYLETGETTKAISLFRQAVALAPQDELPHRALALGLMKAGELTEGIRVVRKALASLDLQKRFQLHLTLCELFTSLAEKTDNQELYRDAMGEAQKAIGLQGNSAEAYFHAGVVSYNQREWIKAKKYFLKSCKHDPNHFDADQNLRRIKVISHEEYWRSQAAMRLGLALSIFCLLAFMGLLYLFLIAKNQRIDNVIVATLAPMLIGGAIVGLLLPYLAKLKFAGVEAELSRPKEQISTGPTGSVGFASSQAGSGPG